MLAPSRQGLPVNRVHCRFVDRAMEFARPTLMSIVLMPTKGIDDDTGIARLLEGTEQRGLRAGLLATERKVPFRLQALDQELHECGRVVANAGRSVRDDQMEVVPPFCENRPGELCHGLQNVRPATRLPFGVIFVLTAAHSEVAKRTATAFAVFR